MEAPAEIWYRRVWIDRAPRYARLPLPLSIIVADPQQGDREGKVGGLQLRRPPEATNYGHARQRMDDELTTINTEVLHACTTRSRANHLQSHKLRAALRRANIIQLTIGSGQLQRLGRLQLRRAVARPDPHKDSFQKTDDPSSINPHNFVCGVARKAIPYNPGGPSP